MCEHFCPYCQEEWSHDVEEPCDAVYTKECPDCHTKIGEHYD